MRKQSAFMNVIVRKFAGAARRRTPRPPESPPSLSTRGEAAAAPPAFPNLVRRRGVTAPVRVEESPPSRAWLRDDCANEAACFFACGEQNSLWALGARVALLLFLIVAPLSSRAAVREVGAIGLT